MRLRRALHTTLGMALVLGAFGCSEKAGVEQETTITGPEGTTTITKETKVESTGDNPPVAVEPGSDATPPSTPQP